MNQTVIYDPLRCETHIGDLVITDQLLAEMGLSVEELLKRVDFTKRSREVRADLKIR